jgi:multiple sugar transport system substrate-binding protein
MKKGFTVFSLIIVLALVLAACATPTPERVVETVVVTQEVEKEVVVTQEVEKEVIVTQEVEVEKIVPGTTITFWSTETQPARAAITQGIIDNFREKTGINVELVLTDEDSLPNLMTAAVAAGTLPDVVFHPIDFTLGWQQQGILDPNAAAGVVESLGAETFAQGSLDLVAVGGEYAAVPSDGWGQLIVYRADWFTENGLEPPTSYANILAAAEALNDPGNNIYGITAATDGGAVFTQQTFEHVALANGCQLVDDSGTVTLDSPSCAEAVAFFDDLMSNYSPPGVQDVVTTRATYFAGQAGMIIWSPFILDEMAGLRDNAFPSCTECADNPAFLAEVSGIVPAFSGPSGADAQYGQISYMGITTSADVAASQQFLDFWFNEGYLDWLSTSVEGKFPMRQGTPENPTAFIDGWKELETGVDRKATLGSIYSDEVIDTLIQGAGSFDRWGFPQGQGPLVTAVYEALPVPRLLRDVLDGVLTPEDAVAEMQLDVEDLQAGLAE